MNQLKVISRSLLVSASLVAGLSGSSYAVAGKIYMNGSWKEVADRAAPVSWNANFLLGGNAGSNIADVAREFLSDSTMNLSGQHQLDNAIVIRGDVLDSVKVAKTWNNMPVVGGETILNFQAGKMVFGNSDGTSLDALVSQPKLSADQAAAIAFSGYRGDAAAAGKPELKVLLLGSADEKEPRLVYEVTIEDRNELSSDVHFIDAHTGQEVLTTSNVQTLMNRQVMAASGTDQDMSLNETGWSLVYNDAGCTGVSGGTGFNALTRRPPTPRPVPGNGNAVLPNPCNKPSDAKVLASATGAWNNSYAVYNYYLNNHKRDSIDGKGMLIRSAVNFGNKFPNAAWVNTKSVMIYGMGDGVETNDFASALDVAGHEMTHGVTARTAALQYADESGALNESYSDVFGKMVAFKSGSSRDWKLGKELFHDGTSFVRDMENPVVGNVSQYKYRGQPCSRFNDFCGVHDNSGIPSKAAVTIANSIGNDNLAKLYYLTLTQLLRTASNFKEARAQTVAACGTLFGATSSNCSAVASAFDSVGITK